MSITPLEDVEIPVPSAESEAAVTTVEPKAARKKPGAGGSTTAEKPKRKVGRPKSVKADDDEKKTNVKRDYHVFEEDAKGNLKPILTAQGVTLDQAFNHIGDDDRKKLVGKKLVAVAERNMARFSPAEEVQTKTKITLGSRG